MKSALPLPGYAAAALAAAVISLLGMTSAPAAPAWWSDPATSIAGNTPVNDWAAANLGQIKHVATQAKAHLDFTLASIGGAGPEIDAMCQFTQQDNYAPAAVGQLKNVAKVFYDRLAQAQWNWQTGYPGTASTPYPWSGTVHAENASPINIGQLKNVFSFDLSSWASFDQDSDSMPDGWEVYYGLNPGNSADADQDRDNDGLTNREEYNANANPLTADTDGDFSPDAEEAAEGTDPRRDTSAPVTLCAVYDSVHWPIDYLPPANPQPWETSHPIWYEYFQRWDGQPAVIRPGGRGGPLYDPPGSLSGQASLIDTAATLTAWNVRWDPATPLASNASFRSDGEGGASTHAARLWLRGPKSSSPVTRTFVKLVRQEVPPVPPLNGITEEYSTVTFTIPANQNHSAPQSFTATLSPAEPARSHTERTDISLLPVEVVELSPKVKDEEGNDVEGSEHPSTGRPLTPFVELNSVTDRIAHRELKVRIGEALKGKTVTWTLDAVPGATPAAIRGRWNHSTTHPDRFETSATYGANGFTRLSQESGRTTVANDGFTAIRVNVPPVGFNQVRIRIQIEGMESPMDLIDMEVPGVVVIDPGHGGSGARNGGSDPNHAVSSSGVLEKTMTLDFGTMMRTRLQTLRTRDQLNLRIFMTRTGDVNPSLAERANRARDVGADIFLSFHFNGYNTIARGTETYYDSTGNFNQAEDQGLAGRVNAAVFGAISANDAGAINRGVKGQGLDVLSDPSLGNTQAYFPIRAVLLETEFIDVPLVDQLLNTNANHQQVRQAIIDALGDALLSDLEHNP